VKSGDIICGPACGLVAGKRAVEAEDAVRTDKGDLVLTSGIYLGVAGGRGVMSAVASLHQYRPGVQRLLAPFSNVTWSTPANWESNPARRRLWDSLVGDSLVGSLRCSTDRT